MLAHEKLDVYRSGSSFWRCQPALAEPSRGATRFSLSKYVQMSRCQNSLTSTSTSTSTSTVCDGHPRVPKMFNLFLEEALHALSQLKPCPMHPRLHGA